LKGAINFMADLMRAIELPVEVDFMAVSSYGAATKTSGVVRIVKDLDVDLAQRDVLIVEDVVDSGLTLNYLRQYLGARRPGASKSARCCSRWASSASSSRSSTSASPFRPTSWWASASTSTSATATLDAIYTYTGEAKRG
jgi:hypoxanthine phosphoribosyltransferase